MPLDRTALLRESALQGSAWCREHCATFDRWLQEVFVDAVTTVLGAGATVPAALVAIGGYGRGDLAPYSDIDVLLVHRKGFDAKALAERLWYPIWDAGVHLGHVVATVPQAMELAGGDLDTATSLLSARHLAGEPQLTAELGERAASQWSGSARKWLTQLGIRVREREHAGHDVAFALEPDLKEGRGGMRDVQSLWWAQRARPVLTGDDEAVLADAYDRFLAARVALQRHAGRATNRITLDDRDPVADALDVRADALLHDLAEAGRAVAWRSDDTWRRSSLSLRGPLGRRGRRARRLADGVEVLDGEVDASEAVVAAPGGALRVARLAAEAGAVLSRDTLHLLAVAGSAPAVPWPPEARADLLGLLGAGRGAVAVIEALDQVGVWSRDVLPEWAAVHARPQHNPYHRFTVDRHLLEAVAGVARATDVPDRPDLVLVAALVHDLGKGADDGDAGDRVARSVERATAVADRWGFPPDDVNVIAFLVRHHLLLLDTASKRDLDDPTTISRVAEAVGSVERLRLLHVLTEADARATGPSAWTPWRDELVHRLVDRVTALLGGGDGVDAGERGPGADLVSTLGRSPRGVEARGHTVTVVADDRPGAFSRIAGALALHGVEVLDAVALSSDDGRAASRFTVVDPLRGDPPWDRIVPDIERALDGRLALAARLAERRAQYERRSAAAPARPSVHFDDDASATATVIDVHTVDATGVLYRITSALAELDLDIRSAKVQTIGREAVDAFYVRDRHGERIEDEGLRAEIVRAITHALSS